MSATVIDGKAFAARLRDRIADYAHAFEEQAGRQAGLAVVLVGEDPASEVYVRSKARATVEAGMASFEFKLPAGTPEEDLLDRVRALNADPKVDGILVQLPLPPHMNEQKVIATIDPNKDVDGFTVVNAGRLASGIPALTPCTPLGCMILLRETVGDLAGLRAGNLAAEVEIVGLLHAGDHGPGERAVVAELDERRQVVRIGIDREAEEEELDQRQADHHAEGDAVAPHLDELLVEHRAEAPEREARGSRPMRDGVRAHACAPFGSPA